MDDLKYSSHSWHCCSISFILIPISVTNWDNVHWSTLFLIKMHYSRSVFRIIRWISFANTLDAKEFSYNSSLLVDLKEMFHFLNFLYRNLPSTMRTLWWPRCDPATSLSNSCCALKGQKPVQRTSLLLLMVTWLPCTYQDPSHHQFWCFQSSPL